jgi:hypothetical protein
MNELSLRLFEYTCLSLGVQLVVVAVLVGTRYIFCEARAVAGMNPPPPAQLMKHNLIQFLTYLNYRMLVF